MIRLVVDHGAIPAHARLTRARQTGIGKRAARFAPGRGQWYADVSFIDAKAMGALNRRYHGGKGVTDVLSFHATPPCAPGYLGEIFVHYPRALAQAKAAGHRVGHEVEILVAHGLLHLLGYDHATKRTEARMFALQETLCDF